MNYMHLESGALSHFVADKHTLSKIHVVQKTHHAGIGLKLLGQGIDVVIKEYWLFAVVFST